MSTALSIGVVARALSDDPRAAAALSRRLGFTGLQFDAFAPSLDLADLSLTGRREFKHMLSAQGQQLIALRCEIGARGFGPGADIDRILARLGEAMEIAAGLDARLLCVDLGPLPPVERQAVPRPRIDPEAAGLLILPAPSAQPTAPPVPLTAVDTVFTQQLDSALAEVGRVADRFNVIVAFRSELAGFDALHRALQSVRCQWFGLDLDPVAVLRDEWSPDEIFSRLGSSIRHVCGRDALVGVDRRTQPALIGQGRTDWPELLAALDAAGYRGWITLDTLEFPDRSAAARAARAYLSPLLGLPLMPEF